MAESNGLPFAVLSLGYIPSLYHWLVDQAIGLHAIDRDVSVCQYTLVACAVTYIDCVRLVERLSNAVSSKTKIRRCDYYAFRGFKALTICGNSVNSSELHGVVFPRSEAT